MKKHSAMECKLFSITSLRMMPPARRMNATRKNVNLNPSVTGTPRVGPGRANVIIR
jgi:hypothetical protein